MGASKERTRLALIGYTLQVQPRAVKAIAKLQTKDQKKIHAALLLLSENPFPPASAKLTNREGYRVRVGNFRILYTVDGKKLIIQIVEVGHRREIYR